MQSQCFHDWHQLSARTLETSQDQMRMQGTNLRIVLSREELIHCRVQRLIHVSILVALFIAHNAFVQEPSTRASCHHSMTEDETNLLVTPLSSPGPGISTTSAHDRRIPHRVSNLPFLWAIRTSEPPGPLLGSVPSSFGSSGGSIGNYKTGPGAMSRAVLVS